VSAAGRVAVAGVALGLALVVYVIAVSSDRFGDAPLFLLVVPMALCTFTYGLWGGIGSTLVGSLMATVWWVEKGYPGGAAWYCSRIVTYVAIGVLLGKMVDSRRALVRQVEQHAELSLDMIATASFEGYFIRVNPAFTRTLGYTREELIGRPFIDFVHPDDRAATIAERDRQTQAGEEVLRFQNRYRCKDGSYRWLEWTSRPDPSTRTLVAVARDVSERKELERREREYQERLEQAVRERTLELRQRNIELEEAKQETLRRLALAAEYRDDETFEHTERVGRTAAQLAAQLGLSDREIKLIRQAAPLHDVGKLGVSDALLLKPGRLTPAEFEHVKRHVADGATILAGSSSDVLNMAEEIARHHHEWWDGTGYPQGLKGTEIPLSARIVALADVFDALTHTRPYKEAWPLGEALAEIHRLAGRQFDPQVVATFDRLDHAELAGLPTKRHIRAVA
jgi:putative two-component system response regulator